MKKYIPYSCQDIDKKDIDAVCRALTSEMITQGESVTHFEKKLSKYTDSKFCSVTNSATSALHLGLLALGATHEDLIWTSTISFVATANVVKMIGAQIDFLDIDISTKNICLDTLERKLEFHSKKHLKLPKIIIPVHMQGLSLCMKSLKRLSKKYKFLILEDASHALGAVYENKKVGSCKYSDATVFSFHAVKMITTAEGGAITTNSQRLDNKIKLLRSHGVSKIIQDQKKSWIYRQLLLGFNYRMNDIQAALGISQLKKLPQFLKKRKILALRYCNLLKNLDLMLPDFDQVNSSSNHLFVILVKDRSGKKREKVFNFLKDHGIGVNVHYIPIHTQRYYKSLGFKKNDYPNSINYYNQCISLPLNTKMTFEEQDYIVEKLKDILN